MTGFIPQASGAHRKDGQPQPQAKASSPILATNPECPPEYLSQAKVTDQITHLKVYKKNC